MILPTIAQLTERQYQLFFLFHTVIAGHTPDGLSRLTDDDVADAAGTFAATIETAARGVLYEHTPESSCARQLGASMKQLLADVEQKLGKPLQRDAVPVLRSIERGAREARQTADGGETAYLQVMQRLLQQSAASAAQAASPSPAAPAPAPRIILP